MTQCLRACVHLQFRKHAIGRDTITQMRYNPHTNWLPTGHSREMTVCSPVVARAVEAWHAVWLLGRLNTIFNKSLLFVASTNKHFFTVSVLISVKVPQIRAPFHGYHAHKHFFTLSVLMGD
jgi:hypothetical protein